MNGQTLPVRIGLLAAPKLVTGYRVSGGFRDNDNQQVGTLNPKAFGPDGGEYKASVPLNQKLNVDITLRVTATFAINGFPEWTTEQSFGKNDIPQLMLQGGIDFDVNLPNADPFVFQLTVNCNEGFFTDDFLQIDWAYKKGAATFEGGSARGQVPLFFETGRPKTVYQSQFFLLPQRSPDERIGLHLTGRYQGPEIVPFDGDLELRPVYAFNVVYQSPGPATLQLLP